MSKLNKPSAGYFLAKRQMQEALLFRINKIDAERQKALLSGDTVVFMQADAVIQALEEVRHYVRNVMLWDTTEGE